MYSESFFCISARRSHALPLPTGVLQGPEQNSTFTNSFNDPFLTLLHLKDGADTDENRYVPTVTHKFFSAVTAAFITNNVFVVILKTFS